MRLPQHHKSAHKRIFHKLQDIPECKTEKCSEQSWNMSQMMDASADPCQDFYQYACGGWIAEGLPEDHAKWTIFAYLAEQTENKLRDLIESQKDAGITVDRVQGSLVLTLLWLGITRLRWSPYSILSHTAAILA